MSVSLKFLGAAGTVTGSKYLVKALDKNLLVDCGLFQGAREWRERNWNDPEIKLSEIDAVLLTHAHIDHIGILPRYYALGLRCPVYCTKPTHDLARILLPDSGYLQEEEASYRSRRSDLSRHHPPLPLYTKQDAEDCLKLFETVKTSQKFSFFMDMHAEWSPTGHILGACAITLQAGDKTINFSGDLGRYDFPILKDPEPVNFGDLLLIESTYGDRDHPHQDPKEVLARVINETYEREGIVVIPSFAVGRTQLILFYLRELKEQGLIPDLPIYIDSPMAIDATDIYRNNKGSYDEESLGLLKNGQKPFEPSRLRFVQSQRESMELNDSVDSAVVIAASGMLSGGRILHHLKHKITSPLNTILFVGFQPPGGRGDWILRGNKFMKIFGHDVPIRAHIEQISGLSAHGDRHEMLKWCRAGRGKPGRVAIVHGEPESAAKFASTLKQELDWDTFVAAYLDTVEI